MSETPQLPDGKAGAGVWSRLAASSLFLRINVVALVVAGIGLVLPRVTAGGAGLVTVRTGYGQVFALLLLVVGATLACWCLGRADWMTAALLFVVWLGLLGLAVFEVVRVSVASSDRVGLAGVGIGLYCNVAGAAVGVLAAMVEGVGQWTGAARPAPRSLGSVDWSRDRGRGLPWVWVAATGVVVLTLAAVGASGQLAGRDDLVRSAAGGFGPRVPLVVGAHDGSHSSDESPVEGRRPTTLPSTTSGVSAAASAVVAGAGGGGSTGATGATGGTGDAGNSGDWGMGIGLADYWPGYTGAPGSFYIWPGYLGPATNTGDTGGSGSTVTGASGLTGSGTGTGTGTGTTGATGTTAATTTTTAPPADVNGSTTFPAPSGPSGGGG